MITPSFGLTATERVLPKLALDFTTASLDSRITFTRTTGVSNPATYVNSNGVLTPATNDQPRFDYDPITLACKGLLIEESRSNTVTYSSDLSNASWAKSNVNTTGTPAYIDVAVAPDNTQTADKFIPNSGQGSANFTKSIAITSGTTYCFSFFAKAAEQSKISLVSNIVTTYRVSVFNLSNGTVSSTASGWTSTIENYGNGWYRCVSVFTATSSITAGFQISNNSAGWTGDGTSGIYIWGAQLEAGAFATSYIPTTSAALTRNADVAAMTGTNFSDWFNASEGTFAYSWQSNGQTNGSQRFGMTVSDGTANNRIRSFVNSSTTQVTTQITSAGVSVASLNNTVAATTGVVNKTCAAYKLDLFASSSNASSPTTDTSGAVPTGINQSIIGADIGSTGFLNGIMQKISYWPQRLTNAEVQAFSK